MEFKLFRGWFAFSANVDAEERDEYVHVEVRGFGNSYEEIVDHMVRLVQDAFIQDIPESLMEFPESIPIRPTKDVDAYLGAYCSSPVQVTVYPFRREA